MGTFVRTEEKSYPGPFILDQPVLESLGPVLDKIEEKLKEGLESLIEEKADDLFEKHSGESDLKAISRSKARKIIANRSSMKKEKKLVSLVSKDGSRLEDAEIVNLLKDSKLDLLQPEELNIRIRYGACEFRLDVAQDDDVHVEVWCEDESINSDIWHLINSWLGEIAPGLPLRGMAYFSDAFKAIGALILAVLLLVELVPDDPSRSDLYASELNKKSDSLLTDGIQNEEVNEVLTILLSKRVGFIPDDYHPKILPTEVAVSRFTWIFGLSLMFLWTTPMTVIAVGRRKWRGTAYKLWKTIVLIWIPSAIIAPMIYDYISNG